jgi:hypothetical protein
MTTISLRRYTTLPFLLDILNKKSLTFLDPKSWRDKDDSYYIELYKSSQRIKSVLVLCFAESKEKYHHWKIYSGNSSGVCVEFRKENLIEDLRVPGVRLGKVEYRTYTQIKRMQPGTSQLPFIKRYAFIDEKEFRAVYEDKGHVCETKEFQIDLHDINRIVFNPWLAESVFESLKNIIKRIDGCEEISIVRTSLTNSEKWRKIGRGIAQNYE